ncbi:MoxR-like ATPase [Nonomuraea solani]|uniref:MoxR-like ATPase n=1 Tax=Nonomuraea solani TaxID=1144553 RepID=A0A1H6DSL4_9ACTN|nr:MoxR family ATPase [Nonomuraea solani]SEG88239.1 MoxR-like ATPase [Nonomuraea solani]
MINPDTPTGRTADRVRPRWWIYRGTGEPLHDTRLSELIPAPPPWRRFADGDVLPPPPQDDAEIVRRLGAQWPDRALSDAAWHEAEMVNATLLLRRPLLVSGRPGTGKSALAYRISRELRLGRVLRWHITSRSTLNAGLYAYDAIGRVQDTATWRAGTGEDDEHSRPPEIGEYIQLGPLGTALLPYAEPRVLLIDELDKSDLDLANDLLSIFEEGSYTIPELLRARRRDPTVRVRTDDPQGEAEITEGRVTCNAFPIVVMTSNGEREFPPAFLRRCLLLDIREPSRDDLAAMLTAHFGSDAAEQWGGLLISQFLERGRERGGLAIDQLLNSLYLASAHQDGRPDDILRMAETLWHRLDGRAWE